MDRYTYDPARARQLLKEAGFFPDLDGTLRNAAGNRLVLELNTTAGNRLREQIAHCRFRQSTQPYLVNQPAACEGLNRLSKLAARRYVDVPKSTDDEHWDPRDTPRQVRQQTKAGSGGPLQIVDYRSWGR